MKTQYQSLIRELIEKLEKSLTRDMGDPEVRDHCSGAMYSTYYKMSSIEEKEFCTWIMNTGNYLNEDPLGISHPEYKDEIEEYKEKVLEVISNLKSYLEEEPYKNRNNNFGKTL